MRSKVPHVAAAVAFAFLLAPLASPAWASASSLHVGRADLATLGVANEPMILAGNSGTDLWVGALTAAWRSTNGGASWSGMSVASVPGFFTDGFALAQDPAGKLYAADTEGQDIWVATSSDKGATWDTTVSRFVVEADGIADRPWLATNGPGNVVLVDNGAFGENCDYSTDGGATFAQRATAKMDQGYVNAGDVLFDSQDHVTYAVQQGIQSWRGSQICTAKSLAVGITSQLPLPHSGSQIFTQLAMDAADRLYVAQPTSANTQMEIRAFDGWNAATLKRLAVSPYSVRSTTFGAIATRSTGEIAVAYYGSTSPGDPAGDFSGSWNLYVARVKGFWTATPSITFDQVTTSPMHYGGMCMDGVTCTSSRELGDYMGVTYDAAGDLHIAYVDDSSGTGVTKYAHLAAI